MVNEVTFDIDKSDELTIFLDAVTPFKTRLEVKSLLKKMSYDKKRFNRNIKALKTYLEYAIETKSDPLYKKNLKWVDFLLQKEEGTK